MSKLLRAHGGCLGAIKGEREIRIKNIGKNE